MQADALSWLRRLVSGAAIAIIAFAAFEPQALGRLSGGNPVDAQLRSELTAQGFTGNVESTLTARLGRPVDDSLANTGRLLWFDTVTGLNGDNTCAGCHSPLTGFGDTQSIAIGVDNNGIVGPGRTGPRNMRRAPSVINTAFYPRLMWNSRFAALSGDPFDNSAGFEFPLPEGLSLSGMPHLLVAQALIPPTERSEVAGFSFVGDNDAIRAEVMRRLNAVPEYRKLFGAVYPSVRSGAPITVAMFGAAIAEFEFSLTFANAPIDRYARGETKALTPNEKDGAVLFFGTAGCVSCHAVSGESNEMFSDFREHVLAVPQLVPRVTNVTFAGAGANEDFGREDVTGNPDDRYAFRTSPLRNVALQPAFMHDGAFTSLEAAITHHLDIVASVRGYDPVRAGVADDLTGPIAPVGPMLQRIDPLVARPLRLTKQEVRDLVTFVRDGLLDPRARPDELQRLIPDRVPSGAPVLTFRSSR